ncbi:hypothetical protein Tco_0552252 [Tanacetum coccineum]
MGRDTIQLEDVVSTISGEYLLEFTSEYGIPKELHPELPGPEDTIVDFPEGKVDINNPCLNVEMDLFNLISAPNPAKVKTETRPRAAHEVPLLTAMANRVIDMEDTTGASRSSGTPSTMEKSPLDFADEDLPSPNTKGVRTEEQIQDEVSHGVPPLENPPTIKFVLEPDLEQEVAAIGSLVHKRHRKRGKSLATIGKAASSTITPTTQDTPAGASSVKDPDPLSYAEPRPIPEQDIARSFKKTVVAEDPNSERSTSFTSMGGSPESVYQSGWGVTNNCRLDTPDVCQDVVDHIAPPGFFSELRQLPNDELPNDHIAPQVAMGSQLRYEQEAKLLKKSVAQVSWRDQKIKAKEKQIKNLEGLLEAEADMKKAAEAKNEELMKELEGLHSQFLDLQLSNQQLSQQVSTPQAQITSEEKIKAVFEEFKKYEDDRVEQRCAEMDARLDKLSVDFDEELYPHMLTVIAGHRWVIGHGLRLAVMKCGETSELRQAFVNVVSAGLVKGMSEGLEHGIEHGKAGRDLEAVEAYLPMSYPLGSLRWEHGKAGRDLVDVEAYDLEANDKLVKTLQDLKDLEYPMVDQLERLKDAPMELIMHALAFSG